MDISLTLAILLGKETGDGTAASSARANVLQGRFGQAANDTLSPLGRCNLLPTGGHPSPRIPSLASRPTRSLTQYPRDPDAALRGFLAQGIEVTAAGHLNP